MSEFQDHNKLDNPVWHSLVETHQHFSIDFDTLKFYNPDHCPFGAFEKPENIAGDIDEYAKLTDNFFIIGSEPHLSEKLKLKQELVCIQMVINNKIDIEIKESIVQLTNEHADILYQLVDLVQPGYFKRKTNLLGDYFGIFKNDELVAVTGERLKMNDFTEVSAVVTHPDHTGKGYAKQLIAHTVNNIFSQNRIPYLHVLETNTAAINLYEKLGFIKRRKMSFWNIIK